MGIRIWRWLAPVLVVALGAGVGLAFVVEAVVRPDPLPVGRTPVPLAGHRPCAAAEVWFENDEAMRYAADHLRDDPKGRHVYTETKAEAWVRFKELFKDQPEVFDSVGADDLSASVIVVPVPDTDLKAYAAELKQRLPYATKADPLDINALRDKARQDKRGPVCPRAGEY